LSVAETLIFPRRDPRQRPKPAFVAYVTRVTHRRLKGWRKEHYDGAKVRFFATLWKDRKTGSAHDFYPNERERDLRCLDQMGHLVIGEFDTAEEANSAIRDALLRQASKDQEI
jgi:hypothetical protein